MTRHGLTLDRAAEALGLSRRTVAYYRSGEQRVPKTVTPATEGYDERQAACQGTPPLAGG
jgi:transcriptional regulator with XRE-family HTH domain